MDLKEAAVLGDRAHRHWYYRAKRAALLRATAAVDPCPVLDVGAGSGFFSRALLEAGRAESALCIDPGYADEHDDHVAGRPLRFRRALPAPQVEAGLVLMMDVLEHVPDDVALVQEYAAAVPPGAQIVVTVPAFGWLWSGHDVFLEHYRRYTLPGLERVLRAAGLRVLFGSYFYGAVLPLAAALRVGRRVAWGRGGGRARAPSSDLRAIGPVPNALLWGLCRAELPLMRLNRVAGLTAFALAAKP